MVFNKICFSYFCFLDFIEKYGSLVIEVYSVFEIRFFYSVGVVCGRDALKVSGRDRVGML